jgi:hypothetical protein
MTGPRGTLTMTYDAIGNLMSRSDVGSYTYHATRRHAVIAAGTNSYSYDANGNMITRNGAQFDYAPDGQRWRQVSSYASGNETTIYVAGLLEELPTRAVTRYMECDQVADSEAEGWRHVCLPSYGTSFCRCLSTGRSWPIVPARERPLPWRTRDYWSREQPILRVIAAPASASAGQRQARRPPRCLLNLIWLELADAVSAWRGYGAGDGNRTHVSRPNVPAGSITWRRCRRCV